MPKRKSMDDVMAFSDGSHDIAIMNNTATMFLGGTQKAWMRGPHQAPCPSAILHAAPLSTTSSNRPAPAVPLSLNASRGAITQEPGGLSRATPLQSRDWNLPSSTTTVLPSPAPSDEEILDHHTSKNHEFIRVNEHEEAIQHTFGQILSRSAEGDSIGYQLEQASLMHENVRVASPTLPSQVVTASIDGPHLAGELRSPQNFGANQARDGNRTGVSESIQNGTPVQSFGESRFVQSPVNLPEQPATATAPYAPQTDTLHHHSNLPSSMAGNQRRPNDLRSQSSGQLQQTTLHTQSYQMSAPPRSSQDRLGTFHFPAALPRSAATSPPVQMSNNRPPNYTHNAPSQASMVDVSRKWLVQLEGLLEIGLIDLEKERLTLIRNAITDNDSIYLVWHQIFCLGPQSPRLPQVLQGSPYVAEAHRIFEGLIFPNTQMRPEITDFFCNFPMSFNSPRDPGVAQVLATDIYRIHSMFGSLATKWQPFLDHCKCRNYPPYARELLEGLGIHITTLRMVIFNYTLRMLWGINPTLLHEAQLIYTRSQLDLSIRRGPNSVDEGRQYQQLYVDLRNRYLGQQSPRPAPNILQSQQPLRHKHLNSASHSPLASPSLGTAPSPVVVAAQGDAGRVTWTQPAVSTTHRQSNQTQYSQHPRTASSRPQGTIAQPQQVLRSMQAAPAPPPHPSRSGGQPNSLQANDQRRHSHFGNVPIIPAGLVSRGTRLVPPLGAPPPSIPTVATPHKSALHQVHLTSPVLRAVQTFNQDKLYQHLYKFATQPFSLRGGNPMTKVRFDVDEQEFGRLPERRSAEDIKLSRPRLINRHSIFLRLRCVKMSTSVSDQSVSSWSVLPTSWIPFAYYRLNGHLLEERRKVFHGKDLPIDITDYIVRGSNKLEVSLLRTSKDTTPNNFAMAVEVARLSSHNEIITECNTKRFVSSIEGREKIKNFLKDGQGDSEIQVVSSNLIINVFDPFSGGGICRIPVRSNQCRHFDCFDLETFLATRPRTPENGPSVYDQWRCPICRGDARPDTLIVDGFMLEVGRVLQVLDPVKRQAARAIIFEMDGSWRAKPEPKSNRSGRNPSLSAEVAPPAPQDSTNQARPAQRVVEIIDLDSD